MSEDEDQTNFEDELRDEELLPNKAAIRAAIALFIAWFSFGFAPGLLRNKSHCTVFCTAIYVSSISIIYTLNNCHTCS
ncbi:MAG: hypothetical protein HRT89_00860 [Lentisphaeria bacterium]|nr:hypothetical protein [Lentisphaeria bacterium]